MPIVNLEYPKFRALDSNGDPLSFGEVEIFLAGTTTQATTYTDAVRTAQNTNPVILSSAGEAEIWFDVAVDVEIRDASAVLQDKILGLAANLSPAVSGDFNLAQNSSFEIDEDEDGAPDNWTLSAEASAVIAIDATVQAHGHNSLKFDGAGAGGGTATSERFNVLTGGEVAIQFTYKSSNAATTNIVQINWYDSANSKVGATITVHTDSATNPTSFTTYNYVKTVPATAIQGELILTGVSSGGGQLSEDTWFDNIQVIAASPAVTLAATQTLTNKTLTSPTITDAGIDNINGVPVYGLVILDSPEPLDTIATAGIGVWYDEVSDSWPNHTLTNANAKKAIIKVTGAFTSAPFNWVAMCRPNGSADSGTITEFARGNGVDVGTTTVNLDGGSLFEWRVDGTFSSGSVTLMLVGYYV